MSAAVSGLLDRGMARFGQGSLARQAVLVFASSMFLNVCGFVFHAIASRFLGVDGYGQFYALVSACTVVALPVALASPVVARFAAEFRALHDDAHMRGMASDVARAFGIAGGVCILTSVVAAGPIGAFMHVPTWSVPFVGIIAALIFANSSFRAIAQGTQQFEVFALSVSTEGAIKVLALIGFMLVGLGLIGSVAAFLCGSLFGFAAIAALLMRRYGSVKPQKIRYDWRRIAVSGLGAAALTIALTLVGTVDAIIVKHYFSASDAGLYSAASQGGKIMLYFVGFIPMILLPQATDRHVRGEKTRTTLLASIGLFTVIAACGLVGVKLFGLQLLHALVGRAFDAADAYLFGYTVAMILLALITLLASYGIATHRLAFAIPLLIGTAATLLSIVFVHASLAQVVSVLGYGMAATCAAVAIALGVQAMRQPPVRAAAA